MASTKKSQPKQLNIFYTIHECKDNGMGYDIADPFGEVVCWAGSESMAAMLASISNRAFQLGRELG